MPAPARNSWTDRRTVDRRTGDLRPTVIQRHYGEPPRWWSQSEFEDRQSASAPAAIRQFGQLLGPASPRSVRCGVNSEVLKGRLWHTGCFVRRFRSRRAHVVMACGVASRHGQRTAPTRRDWVPHPAPTYVTGGDGAPCRARQRLQGRTPVIASQRQPVSENGLRLPVVAPDNSAGAFLASWFVSPDHDVRQSLNRAMAP